MKPTSEKKALIEYGKARGRLEGRRDEFIIADIVFGISKQEAIASFRKHHPVRSALVKDAWQKRAVCRSWVPTDKRYCGNCILEGTYPLEAPCLDCLRNQSVYCEEGGTAGDGDYWEPRKEGE